MKHYQLFLNGAWVDGEESIPVVNPATAEPFATVATVSAETVKQAVETAHGVLPRWSAQTARTRGDYLLRMAAEVERRSDEIARLMTLENGKPLSESRTEVAAAVDHLRWFAEEARRNYGRVVPQQDENKRHLVLHTPVGVVGAISPWNFPLMLAARKVAPALAAGCPVVLKPSEQTPLCALALAEAAEAAELPAGVLQVVLGDARAIGEVFLKHPACRKISFTGSTAVGQELMRGAADGVKRLSLELGGNAPLIVFEDADLEVAVREAMNAKYRNRGQSCIAANRLYAHEAVYSEFRDRFVAATQALKVGDGLEEGVEIGPLNDEKSVQKAQTLIDDAVQRGARVLCGGGSPDRAGYFLEPTILEDVPEAARCLHEEIFAPVAPLLRFRDEGEVIERANATPYGLSAYVFTRDTARVFRLSERLEAGSVGVNVGVLSTSPCPFGGFKHSGLGRELGSEGMEAFLETKHIAIGV